MAEILVLLMFVVLGTMTVVAFFDSLSQRKGRRQLLLQLEKHCKLSECTVPGCLVRPVGEGQEATIEDAASAQ